jgi:flagella basal body P-ring formation protein FlgA
MVPVELRLTQEALQFDVMKGGAVTVVVRRGLVEVTTLGMAGSDADIGSILQVTLRPSNRTVRARLVEKDLAELVDGS